MNGSGLLDIRSRHPKCYSPPEYRLKEKGCPFPPHHSCQRSLPDATGTHHGRRCNASRTSMLSFPGSTRYLYRGSIERCANLGVQLFKRRPEASMTSAEHHGYIFSGLCRCSGSWDFMVWRSELQVCQLMRQTCTTLYERL